MDDHERQHRSSAAEVGWSSSLDRRTAPLRSAALAGLAVGILLLVLAAAWFHHAQNTLGGSPLGPVVCFVLAVGALSWGGLSALAFWVCRAVLSE